MIHTYINSANRTAAGVAHFAAIVWLTLVLLAPTLRALVPGAAEGGASCGMSCCKGAKHACHDGHEADGHARPRWTAAAMCPRGCGQPAGLRDAQFGALSADRSDAGPLTNNALGCSASNLSPARPEAGFALFQRPPPALRFSRS